MSDDICHIRLDFVGFDIAQPETNAVGTFPDVATQCQDAQFTAQSDGVNVPIICGVNTGYHSE